MTKRNRTTWLLAVLGFGVGYLAFARAKRGRTGTIADAFPHGAGNQ